MATVRSAQWRRRLLSPWKGLRNRQVSILLLLLIVAAFLRLYGLGNPASMYSDEPFYVLDAQAYLTGVPAESPYERPNSVTAFPKPSLRISDERSWMHPPLGKLVIAAGIEVSGSNPWGWRIAAAIFGTVGAGLVYLIGWTLWRSTFWSAVAGLGVALDGLHIVHSRMAFLDIFMATFISAACLCLVVEFRRLRFPRVGATRPPSPHVWGSAWLLASGVFIGAAAATKWAGALFILPAATFSLYLAVGAVPKSPRIWTKALARVAIYCIAVPAVVYLASYSLFFAQHGLDMGGFLGLQKQMLSFQLNYKTGIVGASAPTSWPLMLQPFRYYDDYAGTQVFGVGNPVLWWGWLLFLPLLVADIVRRRDPASWLPLLAYSFLFVPWLFVGRTQFFFYMLPAVPFMSLAICGAFRTLPKRWPARVAILYGACLAVAAVAFTPFWLALKVPNEWSSMLYWLESWRG